jgi:hypothetical protein
MEKEEQEKIDLAFLFIGGVHHVLHLAPVAAEIGRRRPDLSVHCFCGDATTAAAVRAVAGDSGTAIRITELRTSVLSRIIMALRGRVTAGKAPMLAAIRWRTRNACAILVPERTSAALRLLGWRGPLIHFRHGAGDRAPASEARLRAFDLIIVPGEKDIERAVARGVDRQRLRAAGYVKLDYLECVPPAAGRLFDNDLPTVFYNPHFDKKTSSIGMAREVIARFRLQERYNLVFAPHVRAVEDFSVGELCALEDLAVPGRIIVDLGSPGLFDMRYVLAADLYLGDMSSQLYEFLVRPRPVAFINAHGVDWRADARYAGWHLGEVADGAADLLAAVDRAFAGHAQKIARQQQAVAFAFGDYHGATARAADIVLEHLSLAPTCAA